MEPKLARLRQKIDTIDLKIMKSLAARQTISRKIGEEKTKLGKRIVDTARFQELLARLLSLSDDLDIPRALVKKIYMAIHEESVKVQRRGDISGKK